jgi:tRNA(adenine34) deaminase
MYKKSLMIAAFEQARNAGLIDEVPVGCIIASNDRIISVGSNKCISKSSPIRHAEIEAIEAACTVLKNYRLPDASIYVTLEPCHMCCMAIVNARIENLYFGAKEPKTGAVVSVDNFLDKKFLNHKVNYSGGYMERESSKLLKDFFATRRKI